MLRLQLFGNWAWNLGPHHHHVRGDEGHAEMEQG